jgi:glucose-1-phosphate adenylyltransferase
LLTTAPSSILFEDCVVKKGAVIDLAILDKRVRVGENARVGFGEQYAVVNRLKPTHLYTGITLIGKNVQIPAGQKIGRNCVIHSGVLETSFLTDLIEAGASLFSDGTIT